MRTRLKWYVLGLAAFVVVPGTAAAEEWVMFRLSGDEPARQAFLINRTTIAHASPDAITVEMAILSESGHRWAPQVVTDIMIDCTAGVGEITRAERRDEHGNLLSLVDDDTYFAALTASDPGKTILRIVCENGWPRGTATFKDLSLTQVYVVAFRSPKNR